MERNYINDAKIALSSRGRNVYAHTNERLSSYIPKIIKKGNNVLSVSASGDQYLSCVHAGASNIDLFDINPLSYYYTMLKICAATHLTYEEYNKFLIEKDGLFRRKKSALNRKYITKIEPYLPLDVVSFYDRLFYNINQNPKLNIRDMFIESTLTTNKSRVTFLKKDTYRELQSKLRERNYPNFVCGDIVSLLPALKSTYDAIILSNIRFYSGYEFLDVMKKPLLEHLNDGGIAQVDYMWTGADDYIKGGKKYFDTNWNLIDDATYDDLDTLIFEGENHDHVSEKKYGKSYDGAVLLKK